MMDTCISYSTPICIFTCIYTEVLNTSIIQPDITIFIALHKLLYYNNSTNMDVQYCSSYHHHLHTQDFVQDFYLFQSSVHTIQYFIFHASMIKYEPPKINKLTIKQKSCINFVYCTNISSV